MDIYELIKQSHSSNVTSIFDEKGPEILTFARLVLYYAPVKAHPLRMSRLFTRLGLFVVKGEIWPSFLQLKDDILQLEASSSAQQSAIRYINGSGCSRDQEGQLRSDYTAFELLDQASRGTDPFFTLFALVTQRLQRGSPFLERSRLFVTAYRPTLFPPLFGVPGRSLTPLARCVYSNLFKHLYRYLDSLVIENLEELYQLTVPKRCLEANEINPTFVTEVIFDGYLASFSGNRWIDLLNGAETYHLGMITFAEFLRMVGEDGD